MRLNKSLYLKYGKRSFDFFAAIILIVLFSPVYLALYITVRLNLGSPVIFKQKRPGYSEKTYEMYKFRSMTDERNKNGDLLEDEMRLTKFGKWLRRSSLDEIPELLNIIKGEMSFIGPRPQLIRDMVFMTEQQRRRHTVFPGLTGWAQVNGRNNISWEDKLKYDIEYIENCTFEFDMKILWLTFYKVIKQDGIGDGDNDFADDFGDYLLKNGKITQEEYQLKMEESLFIK